MTSSLYTLFMVRVALPQGLPEHVAAQILWRPSILVRECLSSSKGRVDDVCDDVADVLYSEIESA